MYEYQEFPKMLYNRQGEYVIVNDPGEEQDMAAEWRPSPNDFLQSALVELPAEKKRAKK